jgi:hypothetical protein
MPVRHVVAHTAIVLGDSKPVEIVIRLRRHKFTDSTDPDFYAFVISSYSGSAWIKTCEGRVKANGKFITTTTSPETLPRHVLVSRWYEILSRVSWTELRPRISGSHQNNLVDNKLLGCSESLEFKNLSGRAIFIPSCSYGCLLSAWHCGHGKTRRS